MNKFGKTPAEVIGEYHPLFRSLLWVSAARSSDEERFILNHVCVQRDGLEYNIIATDGKRLHVATYDPGMFDEDIANIEIGLYEIIAKSAKFIVIAANDDLELSKFPEWKRILPKFRASHTERIEARTISKLGIVTGTLLATDFATQAVGFGNGYKKDDIVDVNFAADPTGGGFLIEHELGKAVVMPMRMHEQEGEERPKDDAEATPVLPGLSEPFQSLAATLEEGESMTISASDEKIVEIKGTKKPSRK